VAQDAQIDEDVKEFVCLRIAIVRSFYHEALFTIDPSNHQFDVSFETIWNQYQKGDHFIVTLLDAFCFLKNTTPTTSNRLDQIAKIHEEFDKLNVPKKLSNQLAIISLEYQTQYAEIRRIYTDLLAQKEVPLLPEEALGIAIYAVRELPKVKDIGEGILLKRRITGLSYTLQLGAKGELFIHDLRRKSKR